MNTTPSETHLAFKSAVEARDADAVHRCLSGDVHFHPPIRFTPFVGRDEVAQALQIPAAVFAFQDTFRYTQVLSAGDEHALFFKADIDGHTLEGVDLIRLDHQGLIAELRVMMRPLAEIQRFAAAAQIVNGRSTT